MSERMERGEAAANLPRGLKSPSLDERFAVELIAGITKRQLQLL
jgi:hypothetical protein